jgi:cytochrome P450
MTAPSACPAHASFNPFDPAYLADPYPQLADSPAAFYAPELDMWVLTRFDDLDAVFRDPVTYSAAIVQDPLFPLSQEARAELGPDFPLPRTMSNADPPDHSRIRRINLQAFSARRRADRRAADHRVVRPRRRPEPPAAGVHDLRLDRIPGG